MLAAYVSEANPADPLAALIVGERPEPEAREGWVTVQVKAAALNHHDVWSLRGVGLPAERMPMILGCDAAGIDPDGNEVIVHSVISDPGWRGSEIYDPKRSLLSEQHQGTLAEQVTVPAGNLIPKPGSLSFEEAACLPTAWLTAYRMLFSRAELQPGQTVLVQGAGGGVASAATALASASGARVWVTGRDERKRNFALAQGAHAVFEPGERLPGRVQAVIETVGEATWEHSIKSLDQGGKLVVAGATSGMNPGASLAHVFFRQLEILGSTMGTREDLGQLVRMLELTGLRPPIAQTLPLADAADAFAAMIAGDVLGKLVLVP